MFPGRLALRLAFLPVKRGIAVRDVLPARVAKLARHLVNPALRAFQFQIIADGRFVKHHVGRVGHFALAPRRVDGAILLVAENLFKPSSSRISPRRWPSSTWVSISRRIL